MRTFLAVIYCLMFSCPVFAGMEYNLKQMVGFTIVYAGYITDSAEKNYSEKYLQLDNGWSFKLDCMMLMPLNMTDVIVFGKKYPEEVVKKFPNIPPNLTYQFKLLIDREVCDASLIN